MFQAVFPPIIRSPETVQASGIVKLFWWLPPAVGRRKAWQYPMHVHMNIKLLQECNTSVQKPLVRIMYSLQLALHYECDLRIGQNTVHNQFLWLDNKPTGLYSTHEYLDSSWCSRPNPFYDSSQIQQHPRTQHNEIKSNSNSVYMKEEVVRPKLRKVPVR
jgi:hypothetical protein